MKILYRVAVRLNTELLYGLLIMKYFVKIIKVGFTFNSKFLYKINSILIFLNYVGYYILCNSIIIIIITNIELVILLLVEVIDSLFVLTLIVFTINRILFIIFLFFIL